MFDIGCGFARKKIEIEFEDLTQYHCGGMYVIVLQSEDLLNRLAVCVTRKQAKDLADMIHKNLGKEG